MNFKKNLLVNFCKILKKGQFTRILNLEKGFKFCKKINKYSIKFVNFNSKIGNFFEI